MKKFLYNLGVLVLLLSIIGFFGSLVLLFIFSSLKYPDEYIQILACVCFGSAWSFIFLGIILGNTQIE